MTEVVNVAEQKSESRSSERYFSSDLARSTRDEVLNWTGFSPQSLWITFSIVGSSLFLALGLTTALAAGLLLGVGLDLIVFVDKFSILSALLFYATIGGALLSPLLAVPRSTLAVLRRHEQARSRYDDARRLQDEKITKLRARKAELEQPTTVTTRTPGVSERTMPAVEANPFRKLTGSFGFVGRLAGWITRRPTDTAEKTNPVAPQNTSTELTELKAKIAAAQELLKTLDANPPRTIHVRLLVALRWLCYATYAVVVLLVLFMCLQPSAAIVFALVFAVLAAATVKYGFDVTGSLIAGSVLVFGYFLGEAIRKLEPNVQMSLAGEQLQARVLMATQQGFIVLRRPQADGATSVEYIRGEEVKRVSLTRQQNDQSLVETKAIALWDWITK